jgi:predicted Zn finger-like uncharacterized protein
VKFLCDRCKTRYSIADERVRGKILKIRCKNCANVITVREGMESSEESKAAPLPQSPAASNRSMPRAAIAPGAGAPARPLEAAFASAMSSPGISVPPAAPAALEEEWYVSIDGDQSGPFSLSQAQAWVAGRRNDDELYCWSEGFDDWLPVEKVSHFRGLRGRSRPRTEPPPVRAEHRQHLTPEPQPLFAATLAALEAEAAPATTPMNDLLPRAQPRAVGGSAGATTPHAKNGRATPVPSPAAPSPSAPVPSAAPAIPSGPSSANNGRATGAKPQLPGPGVGGRAGAPPLPGSGPMKQPSSPGAPALGARDASVPTPSGSSGSGGSGAASAPPVPASRQTPAPGAALPSSISSMFGKSGATPAPATGGSGPANGAKGANGHTAPVDQSTGRPMFDNAILDDDDEAGAAGEPDALSAGAARSSSQSEGESDGIVDDLAIGEVSRVVRIADISRTPSAPVARPSSTAIRRTPAHAAAVARGTGAVPKFDAASLAASGDALAPPGNNTLSLPPLSGTESELVQQLAEPAKPPGKLVWILGGVGLLAIITTLVIIIAAQGDDEPEQGARLIDDGTDIQDVSVEVTATVIPNTPDPPVGSGSGSAGTGKTGTGKTGTGKTGTSGGSQNSGTQVKPPIAGREGLTSLTGDDVVAMSNKMSTGPRRCYEQAKRKDPFLDVKRLRAVITVNTSGTVTRVELLDHANDQLDTCLSNAIGRWKFRENSEGLTSQVSFQFMST